MIILPKERKQVILRGIGFKYNHFAPKDLLEGMLSRWNWEATFIYLQYDLQLGNHLFQNRLQHFPLFYSSGLQN